MNVRFQRNGSLAVLTLDSPPLNLLGAELIADLIAAVGAVEREEGLRALLLRGEGKLFSAGPTSPSSRGRTPTNCAR